MRDRSGRDGDDVVSDRRVTKFSMRRDEEFRRFDDSHAF